MADVKYFAPLQILCGGADIINIELMVQSYLEFYDYYNEAKRRAELTGEPIKTDYANREEFVDKRMQEEGYNFGNVGKGR